jgi:hypothetical protein
MKNFLLILVILFIISGTASGQAPGKKRYKATYSAVPPVIDGKVNDDVWKNGGWVDDFTQYEPYNGQKPSQRTEFNIIFDDNNLYVAVKSFDLNPDSIVKRLTRRDQVDGDMVGVVFDSFHDLRTGFMFGASVAGVKFDQMLNNDGESQDETWDPNWWVATSVDSLGWIAEMKIPFSQLRFEKGSDEVWGLDVFRTIYRKQEMSFWQHISKDAPGMIHLMGEMSGIEAVKPRKIFDVTPYGVAKLETFEAEEGNPFLANGKKSGANAGLDAKIGLTNNMTMDLTINPDFGQVEADPSVVNLSAYETFYEEKRPFFIEGNNITSFGLGIGDGGIGNDGLFYSRRVGRRPQGYPESDKDPYYVDMPKYTSILGAAKLTGKSKDGLSIGVVEAVTANEKAEVDTVGGRYSESVEPLTNYFVGRVQKDFKEGNTIIGGILTSAYRDLDPNLAEFMHKSAFSGGLDFTQYFKDKSWMFNVNAAMSNVNGTKEAISITQQSSARYYQRPDKDYAVYDPDKTSLTGSGGRMQFSKLNGHWNMLGALLWKTPGFETNDMGYLREADQLLSIFWVGYKQWEPKKFYRSYQINMDVYTGWNFGGNWIAKGIEGNVNLNFKNYWWVFTGFNTALPFLSSSMLRGGPMMKLPGEFNYRLGFNTDDRKKLVFEVFNRISTGFENSSLSYNAEVTASVKPTNYLKISISPGYSISNEELQYVSKKKYGAGDRYIFGTINQQTLSASLRINLNLSPDLTLQYWGQPFVATGKYTNHKFITDPLADEFKNRFSIYDENQITYNETDNIYEIDENRDGTVDYNFGNRDFNVQEFLSNLVLRWEYNPGSSVYLVWSQTRSGYNPNGNMNVGEDLGNLFDSEENHPNNVFLIKFSYRFGLR